MDGSVLFNLGIPLRYTAKTATDRGLLSLPQLLQRVEFRCQVQSITLCYQIAPSWLAVQFLSSAEPNPKQRCLGSEAADLARRSVLKYLVLCADATSRSVYQHIYEQLADT